jgi:hypothetical protein
VYLNKTGAIRTSCERVKTQLDRLRQARGWLARFPIVNKSLQELNQLADRWLGSDVALAKLMDDFLREVNSTLDSINNEFPSNISNARTKLFSELFGQKLEEDFLRIKALLSVLDGISESLKTRR